MAPPLATLLLIEFELNEPGSRSFMYCCDFVAHLLNLALFCSTFAFLNRLTHFHAAREALGFSLYKSGCRTVSNNGSGSGLAPA